MPNEPTVAGIVLGLLVFAAGTSDRTGSIGALVLFALSIVWLRVNASMEGVVLIRFAEGRGFTAADMAGLVGILVSMWRLSPYVVRRVRRN